MIFLSWLYRVFARLHRSFYASGFKKSIRIKKPVLSVGNLTFGGTGKTPFVLKLVEDIKAIGFKPSIVVRSYKGQAQSSSLLDLEKARHPEVWGDEACLYVEKLQVPVYSGPRKWESALLVEKDNQTDILVLDDGFQHHRLYQNWKVVLIDALAGLEDLKKRARESLSALQFADVIVLTRANLVSKENLKRLEGALPSQKPLFRHFTAVKALRNLNGAKVSADNESQGGRVGLVSGIANPASFAQVFKLRYPESQIFTLEFPDHHAYQQEDLKKIEKFQSENKLDFVVTTEKDEIKLKKLVEASSDSSLIGMKVLSIESRFENQEEWLAYLRGLMR